MSENLLHPRRVRAPEFAPGDWINIAAPLTMAALRGQAVLVDFWEYTCINCLRTLPYLRQWHARYSAHGLAVIGVHAPEFTFGRERGQVEAAVRDLNIPYPVLLDDHYATWDAFANRYWPSKYLIDPQGYIRWQSHGEGGYSDFERAIQAVLLEADPDLTLPPVMQPLRPEDAPGAVCYRPTPELHAGLDRGALGNPEGYSGSVPIVYRMPAERPHNAFYAEGAWQAGQEYLSYQGQAEGIIRLPYEAVEVNAVLAPHYDALERAIHPQMVSVEVWQDDLPLAETARGLDVTSAGRVLVDRPRMYSLVRNAGFERHELTLRVRLRGFALYAFSFTGCIRK